MTTMARHDPSLLAESAASRPPGSLPEEDFEDRCDRCGDCFAVCPEGLLVADGLGLPVIDRLRGVCGSCGLCADVCTRGAIGFAASLSLADRARRLARIRRTRRRVEIVADGPVLAEGPGFRATPPTASAGA